MLRTILCSIVPLFLFLTACSETRAGERDEFIQRVEASLADVRQRLDDVDDRIEAAGADVRDGLRETREELEEKADALGDELSEMADSTGDTFARMRDEIAGGLEELQADTERFLDSLG